MQPVQSRWRTFQWKMSTCKRRVLSSNTFIKLFTNFRRQIREHPIKVLNVATDHLNAAVVIRSGYLIAFIKTIVRNVQNAPKSKIKNAPPPKMFNILPKKWYNFYFLFNKQNVTTVHRKFSLLYP